MTKKTTSTIRSSQKTSPRAATKTARPIPTPSELGYRWPAEWEPQRTTWLAWPHNRTDWPGKFEPIPYVYGEIIRTLTRVGQVDLIVNDAKAEARAREILTNVNVLPARSARLVFHQWPTNRVWLRDSGPTFVKHKSGEVSACDWRFNAWAKYKDWRLDNTLPEKIADLRAYRRFIPMRDAENEFVLEGGSIDGNGRGLVLTTEECLLSEVQQRNPGLTPAQIERTLCRMLGAKKVLWLERGIVGDDTHGHIDDIARFVGPRTVVAADEPDPADPNHAILRANLKRLRKMTDARGHALDVVSLPLPTPVVFKGQRVPASYTNFYISNGLVLVPTFDDVHDLAALNILQKVLPRHKIVPIYCGDLIWGLGAIHCMTQQEPA